MHDQDPLRLVQLAKIIRGMKQDDKQMDMRIRVLENMLAIGADPAMHQAGFNNVMMPQVVYPTKVTTVDTSNCSFQAVRVQPTGSACNPWEPDTVATTPITVDVADASHLPVVNEYVAALFVGTYDSDFNGKYGLFDRVHDVAVTRSGANTVYPTNRLNFTECFTINESPAGVANVSLYFEVGGGVGGGTYHVCDLQFSSCFDLSQVGGQVNIDLIAGLNTTITVATSIYKSGTQICANMVDLAFQCGLLTGTGAGTVVCIDCCDESLPAAPMASPPTDWTMLP